ncbi:MAG TPA: phosphotransferase [Chloroflexota bacterium]|nr:phosphotransferase [Chloroflexota bacterium]
MSDVLAARVAALTGVARGEVRVRARPPIDHQSNRLHDVWLGERHLIAKEFLKADELATAPVREHRALELLAPLDLAPRPVAIEPEPRPPLGPLVLYEFMDGAMWDRRRPTRDDLARLAEVWLAMHRVPSDDLWASRGHDQTPAEIEHGFRERFQAYGRWAEAEFPEGRRGLELCLELLERRRGVGRELDTHEPVACFCRSDNRFANVIARPDGRLGMVDWEDSGLGDPAKDLADLATHANQEDLLAPDDLRAFLVPYLAERGRLDPGLERRMQLYLALFPLFWLAGLLEGGVRRAAAGGLSGWRVNGLPANQRLRRYLARAASWPATDFSADLAALESLRFFPDRPPPAGTAA